MKTIIVLGKGRGGTTLVASILHKLGVNMGRNMKGPIPINPKGCFENLEILNLTQKLLREAKCAGSLDNLDMVESQKRILALRDKYDPLIREVIKDSESELWGWKDERSCFVLDLFLPYLTNLHFIVVHRDMYSVARSLQSADDLPITDGLRSSIAYYQRIFEILDKTDYPRMHISFGEFFTDKKTEIINNICDFIDIERKELKDVVDNNLRHYI